MCVELAHLLRTFWYVSAALQVPAPAQTAGDGDLKLVFPAGLLCSDAPKVALL